MPGLSVATRAGGARPRRTHPDWEGTVHQNPPAVWVPAIFVDNPWSKGLGRDVQGFDKRMAEFRHPDETRLRPDGCSSPQNPPVGLVKVVAINLPQRAGDIGAAGQPLLDISYDVPLPPNGVNFQRVAPGVGFPHGGPRWRKEDFDLKERGAPFELDPSFVDLAVSYSFFDFLSLQLAPAGKRMFDNAFIRSTFKLVGQPEFEEPSVTGAITLQPAPERRRHGTLYAGSRVKRHIKEQLQNILPFRAGCIV